MRQAQQFREQHARLAEALIFALQSRQHQVRFFALDRRRQRFRRAERIERVRLVIRDVHAAVGALGQRFLDRLLHALRAHRHGDHFAGVFFLQAQGFLERVTIRLVHLKSDVGFANPACVGNGQGSVLGGHLLDADDNLHSYLSL